MTQQSSNKSLSARIRRRNKQGFKGEGTNRHCYFGGGDYRDEVQNHKLIDRINDMAKKCKLGYQPDETKTDARGRVFLVKHKCRCMNKRYVDNHQKM